MSYSTKSMTVVAAAFALSLTAGTPVFAQSVPTSAGARATAGSYNFNVSNGSIFAGGTVTTNAMGHAISISGLVNGTDTITGLSNYASADNDLYTTGAFVTFAGLSFSTAAVGSFNFFNNGNGYYGFLSSVINANGYPDNRIATAAVAPVPEPTTWYMMLVGFGAVGFGVRRRARMVVFQSA